jgi:hypothetical protein
MSPTPVVVEVVDTVVVAAGTRFNRVAIGATWLEIVLTAATWGLTGVCTTWAIATAEGTTLESSDSRGEISLGKVRRFSFMVRLLTGGETAASVFNEAVICTFVNAHLLPGGNAYRMPKREPPSRSD